MFYAVLLPCFVEIVEMIVVPCIVTVPNKQWSFLLSSSPRFSSFDLLFSYLLVQFYFIPVLFSSTFCLLASCRTPSHTSLDTVSHIPTHLPYPCSLPFSHTCLPSPIPLFLMTDDEDRRERSKSDVDRDDKVHPNTLFLPRVLLIPSLLWCVLDMKTHFTIPRVYFTISWMCNLHFTT